MIHMTITERRLFDVIPLGWTASCSCGWRSWRPWLFDVQRDALTHLAVWHGGHGGPKIRFETAE